MTSVIFCDHSSRPCSATSPTPCLLKTEATVWAGWRPFQQDAPIARLHYLALLCIHPLRSRHHSLPLLDKTTNHNFFRDPVHTNSFRSYFDSHSSVILGITELNLDRERFHDPSIHSPDPTQSHNMASSYFSISVYSVMGPHQCSPRNPFRALPGGPFFRARRIHHCIAQRFHP